VCRKKNHIPVIGTDDTIPKGMAKEAAFKSGHQYHLNEVTGEFEPAKKEPVPIRERAIQTLEWNLPEERTKDNTETHLCSHCVSAAREDATYA